MPSLAPRSMLHAGVIKVSGGPDYRWHPTVDAPKSPLLHLQGRKSPKIFGCVTMILNSQGKFCEEQKKKVLNFIRNRLKLPSQIWDRLEKNLKSKWKKEAFSTVFKDNAISQPTFYPPGPMFEPPPTYITPHSICAPVHVLFWKLWYIERCIM